jgi:hypothetical protein
MIHHHEAIVARIEQLEHADIHDVRRASGAALRLYALISVHFRKEEDLQLPAFDAAPADITEAVLKRMATETSHSHKRAHPRPSEPRRNR